MLAVLQQLGPSQVIFRLQSPDFLKLFFRLPVMPVEFPMGSMEFPTLPVPLQMPFMQLFKNPLVFPVSHNVSLPPEPFPKGSISIYNITIVNNNYKYEIKKL